MSDIDFDELDKAVNNVLDAKKPASQPSVGVTQTPDRPSEQVQTQVVVEPATASGQPDPVAPAARQSLSSPATRRSGRFMDMVHPSSDMAGETAAAKPTPRLKIVPSADFADDQAKPADADDLSIVEDSSDETEEPEVSALEPTYPDPLDLMDQARPEATDLSSEATEATDDPIVKEQPQVTAPIAPVPTETPFLTDARVEKRPLGGFGVSEQPEADEILETDTQLEPQTAMPASLQSDIVAVESSDVVEDISEPTEKEESKHDTPKETIAPAQTTPSIPQQYKVAPREDDETPHPIFDTDQYHQPLIAAHAAQKGSKTWVFILLIIGLLVVGAALGYFAFMTGL